MKRVLLTGATGLVGRHLLAELSTSHFAVHALVNRSAPPEELRPLATWHQADLLDSASVDAAIAASQPSLLFHLAWPALTGNLNDVDTHRRFQAASETVVKRFYARGGERVIGAGTCFEYDWSDGVCVEDRTPTLPSTVYGACKDALRRSLQQAAHSAKGSWAWARIFFVYGPHQDRTRFVPAVIRGLLANESVRCTEGRQIRDYLHAHDVARGLIHLAQSHHDGVWNLGSGEPATLRDVALAIADVIGGHHLLEFGAKPTPAGEPAVILADTHRLRDELGWRPRFSLTAGLADTIAFHRAATGVPALT